VAKYKHYNYDQVNLIPVSFKEQILPGSFEYALNNIIDNELAGLSLFDSRYKNDEKGAAAFDPAILLKIILYAYSRGITSSRRIEFCCKTNVVFKALSANTQPHFTTIANFISSMDEQIGPLFSKVVLICDEMNLIGKNMFAIDGCKVSSNASKEWSGTKEELLKKQVKIEKTIDYILKKHRNEDEKEVSNLSVEEEEARHIESLRKKVKKIEKFLSENEDRRGVGGNIIKSNITDNESGKMPSSHGVIQGYNGIAAADEKHQVVVHAEAIGSGSEHETLSGMIDGIEEKLNGSDKSKGSDLKGKKVLADSGFHSEKNMKMLSEKGIDGYVADGKFRKRDPRFANADRHKKVINKKKKPVRKYFGPSDFKEEGDRKKAICPAGKEMYLEQSNYNKNGNIWTVYCGKKNDCSVCDIREKCMRSLKTPSRKVMFFKGKKEGFKENFTQKMIKKIDSEEGRKVYSKRMGLIEPVFGNIRNNLGLDRFSLRGKKKVNIQWKLFCMVHNLLKIHRYGEVV